MPQVKSWEEEVAAAMRVGGGSTPGSFQNTENLTHVEGRHKLHEAPKAGLLFSNENEECCCQEGHALEGTQDQVSPEREGTEKQAHKRKPDLQDFMGTDRQRERERVRENTHLCVAQFRIPGRIGTKDPCQPLYPAGECTNNSERGCHEMQLVHKAKDVTHGEAHPSDSAPPENSSWEGWVRKMSLSILSSYPVS